MKFALKIFLFIFLYPLQIYSANEAVNWYFGDKAALNFKTSDGEPIIIEDSKLSTLEGCSSISDTNGSLLFYTDGVDVYNKDNELMNPSIKLNGHFSSSQSAMIVRKPYSEHLYYIFTTDAGLYVENIDTNVYKNKGLCYSIVDMSKNNGKGEIILYNEQIFSPCTEKLTSVYHENGKDIWIITHEWDSKNFVALLLTKDGLLPAVKSEGTISHSGESQRFIGIIKVSPNGKFVASSVQGLDFVELIEFNSLTGEFDNPIRIQTKNRFNNYGLEFSQNSNLLYVTDYDKKTLHQYDISNFDSEVIVKSEYLVFRDTVSHSVGALQIAPNGKIYMAINLNKNLASINFPDKLKDSCGFIFNSIELNGITSMRSRHGLPNINQSFFEFKSKIDYSKPCSGDPLVLKSKVNAEFSNILYEWTAPNGIVTYSKDLIFSGANPSLNGMYYLRTKYRDYQAYDSIYVKIEQTPIVKILGDTLLCVNTNAVLKASSVSDSLNYYWSNGSRSHSTIISSPGVYSLSTQFPNGCFNHDTIEVKGLITNADFRNQNVGLFGNIPIETNKLIKFEFINYDDQQLKIEDIYIERYNGNISIKNRQANLGNLNSNSVRTIDVEIFSSKPAHINDSLVIEVKSPYCTLLFKAPIVGNIIVPVKITFPTFSSEPSKKLDIPIYSQISQLTDSKFNQSYQAELSFDSDYFFPDSCINCTFTDNFVIDGVRYLSLNGNNSNLSDDETILCKISGTILIGSEVPAPVKIRAVEWNDSLFVTEPIDGSIEITGCSIPLRPIQLFEATRIDVGPNPCYDFYVNVKVYTSERGTFKIYIGDGVGSQKELFNWVRNDGDTKYFDFNLNLNEFSSGVYNIILNSPWSVNSQKLILVR